MDPDGGPVNPVPHKVGKSTVQDDEVDEEVNTVYKIVSEEIPEEIPEEVKLPEKFFNTILYLIFY